MRSYIVVVGSSIAALALAGCAHQKAAKNPLAATQVERPASSSMKPTAQPWSPATTSGSSASSGDRSAYFDFNSDLLRQADFPRLQQVARKLRSRRGSMLRIEGNCDERGTDAYNLALGEQRAQAAKRYLKRLGVDPSRVRTLSYGNERPKYQGHDEAAWSKNRRDDFVVQ
jgi:peptidoglycan-associated lipoprotein